MHIWMGRNTEEGVVPEKIEFEPNVGKGIMKKDYSYEKISLRKKTGTPEQVKKAIVEYFKKLKEKFIEMNKKGEISEIVSKKY